ncbi:MAG: hypothetical protein KIT83_16130 [Bryobacterales bacterium]|nr:hypothetical protein [Bryobacterales bacterium]
MTRRWKNLSWFCLAILAMALVISSVTPNAIAQIRASLVRDVDSPVRGIRHIENQNFSYPTGAFSVNGTITPVIPAGKKLVLQSASAHTILTDLQSSMEVRLGISGVGAIGYVPQVFQATSSSAGNQRHFTGDTALGVVLNPGEQVTVFVFRNNNLGTQALNFTRIVLVGYLVDANL